MTAGRGSGGHGGRRRQKKQEPEEHENHERWAVSYADMMTVLVGLFIVLYSISQVDQQKFEELRDSLAIGFGNRAPSIIEGSTGALTGVQSVEVTPDLSADVGSDAVPPVAPAPDTEGLTEEQKNYIAAAVELDHLAEIADQVTGTLAAQGLGDRVRLRITDRGLVIGMVADDVFFGADTATLTGTALSVIDSVAPILAAQVEELSVEGHANVLPSVRFPTNWELSSARATEVLRRMVARGVPANRIAAVGFGDARPLNEPGVDPIEANRRVDVVVLSGVPEEIRQLLPTVFAQRGL